MLSQLYNKAIKNIYKNYTTKEIGQFWSPFIPFAYDEYKRAKTKIMIIGQEPVGWGQYKSLKKKKELKDCQKEKLLYSELIGFNKLFMNAENNNLKESRNSRKAPFWSFAKKISVSFNLTNDRRAILWNNLFKLTDDSEMVNELKLKALKDFNLLEEDIDEFKPDICIFTIGSYDEHLSKILDYNHNKDLTASYKSNIITLKKFEKVFAIVTNHPRYLQMNGYTDDFITKLRNSYRKFK